MPDFQIPVVPIPEKLQFQELPACADMVARKIPNYPVPVFLLAVTKHSGPGLQVPEPVERMVVMIFDHELESAARNVCSAIEASDLKRFTKPPNPQKLPELRPQISLREIFESLQEARMTVFTVAFKDDGDPTPCFVAFMRSAQTIAVFETGMKKITKAHESPN